MRTLLVLAFLTASGTSLALAQTGTSGGLLEPVNPNSPGASASGTAGVGAAPIGHRQPRVSEVPSEKNLANPDDPISREDAALDRKIKGICRGC